MSDGPKKIFLNKPTKREALVALPAIEHLIDDSLRIIELELVKFRNKVNRGESLTNSEGALLGTYVKSLLSLAKEQDRREKDADLTNLSDEELLELARKLEKSKSKIE